MKKILFFITMTMFFFLFAVHADDLNEEEFVTSVFEDYSIEVFGENEPEINARSAIVMDFDSGRVLYEKNAWIKRPMASTTKVMTAIVALENGNMDDIVTVSKKAASIHGSVIHLTAGEKLSFRELMYGLMMRSGNDAAIAIAEHVGGSVEGFVAMMNEKAKSIGALNTNFTTPHGLDEVGHHSTAYDMALITRYALQNPIINEIVKTTYAQVGKRSMVNTNEMLSGYAGADGVKTGYTGKAGRCLITSATREGRRYISVVLFCDSKNLRALSSKKILDYAFANYYPHTLINSEYIGSLPVYKGFEKQVPIYVEKNITLPITTEEKNNLYTKVSLPDILHAPIQQKEAVGTVSIYVGNKILCEYVIRPGKTIRQKTMPQYILDVFIALFKLFK
ncbi:MAG: D-alanyl-D-alanine carboxypeptidase [Clostridiaceae bacterium]|nr:D-alanyl-D-alanine carboxypeptidase [Clostridiaceae bacterium]